MTLLKKVVPPKKWRLPVFILMGIAAGLGFFMIKEAKVLAYLSDEPTACINCHVMNAEYITWDHSSHREVATCNDCHVPQDNVFKKYFFKAKDGLYHASIFTLRMEPEAIVMHEAGQEVVHQNCIRCHQDQVTDPKALSWIATHKGDRLDRTCWECHREVPHGRVRSLSSSGYQIAPIPIREQQQLFVPTWLEEQLDENRKQKK